MHVDNIKKFICQSKAQTNYYKIVELLKSCSCIFEVLKVFNISTILEKIALVGQIEDLIISYGFLLIVTSLDILYKLFFLLIFQVG